MDPPRAKRWRAGRASILGAMVAAGGLSTFAQVLLLRELLVVFSGNEVAVGTILGSWLIWVATGALFGRIALPHVSPSSCQPLFGGVLTALGCLLPAQVGGSRLIRALLNVPVGEFAAVLDVVAASFLVVAPGCLGIGFCFPLATHLPAQCGTDRYDVGPASRVYTAEAVGSAASGALLTFALLPHLDAVALTVVGVAVAWCGAAVLARRRAIGLLGAGVAVVLVLGVLTDAPGTAALRHAFRTTRWRTLGVLGEPGRGPTRIRLVDTADSVYQNVALIESEGQFAVYGNGEPLFAFPDPVGDEHMIHALMAQHPEAHRILVLGGNPVGPLAEWLKYNPSRLVHVSLDPVVTRLVAEARPAAYKDVVTATVVELVTSDAVRYVRACDETFDAIVINAPPPSSLANNRFYCRGFYLELRRLLARRGFVTCAVASSVRLQQETASLSASILRTLASVFDRVLVTAGSENRFFAGGAESTLTLDRNTLVRRARDADIATGYFLPEYFLADDAMAPDKVAFVRRRLESVRGAVNTIESPLSYRAYLTLWSRFSGSDGVGGALQRLDGATLGWQGVGAAALAAAFVLGAGMVVRRRRRQGVSRWSAAMAAAVSALTGFGGMALNVLMLLFFQSVFGFIYARVGVLVALFMLGLIAGAPSGRWLSAGSRQRHAIAYALTQLLLIGMTVAIYSAGRHYAASGGIGLPVSVLEWALYGGMAFLGWLVGAQFPLANRVCLESGGGLTAGAAVIDAADHAGAALGAIGIGAFCIPVFGLDGAGLVIAGATALGLCCLVSALVAMPRRPE